MQTQPPSHNFYAVIPSAVLYCKNLEPNAKLFYGTLSSLMQKEGYCWASNKYFADLYEVDERTIQLWLASLQKEEFIFVEIQKEKLKILRKIWLGEEFKKFLRSEKNFTLDTKKISPNRDSNNYKDKEDINCNVRTPKSESDSPQKNPPLKNEEAEKSAKKMFEKIKSIHPSAKEPNYKNWILDFERLNRIDGRSWDEIHEMIDWIYNDPFWFKNILCPEKLRAQWDKLMMQRLNNKSIKKNPININRSLAIEAKNELRKIGKQNQMLILYDKVLNSDTNEFAFYDQPTDDFIEKVSLIFKMQRS